jgi:hypothetical protein
LITTPTCQLFGIMGGMSFEFHQLQADLNKLHPNASSNSVVEYGGVQYQINYYAIERQGKMVTKWGHVWKPVVANVMSINPTKKQRDTSHRQSRASWKRMVKKIKG